MLSLAILANATEVCGQSPRAGSHEVGTEAAPVEVTAAKPFDMTYDNIKDDNHEKELTFEATFANADPTMGTTVKVQFFWPHPTLPGFEQSSPVSNIPLMAGETQTWEGDDTDGMPAIHHTIPFCPPKVRLQISNMGPGSPVKVVGTFTHVCQVPEPANLSIAAGGIIGVLSMRRRRTER
jgi:hypothetical protein